MTRSKFSTKWSCWRPVLDCPWVHFPDRNQLRQAWVTMAIITAILMAPTGL
jgi:hypothetical protein